MPAGNKCSYKNCGKSQKMHPGLHMFKFPIKPEERCKEWILNSGGEQSLVDLLPHELKRRKICEDHFDPSAFSNELKQRLNHSAVPKHFQCFTRESNPVTEVSVSETNEVSPGCSTTLDDKALLLKRMENQSTMDDLFKTTATSTVAPSTSVTVPILEFISQEHRAVLLSDAKKSKKINDQRLEIVKLKRKIRSLEKARRASSTNPLLRMQEIRKSKSRQRWSTEQIDLAFNIFYTSPACYKKLKEMGILLPGVSTLQAYLNKITIFQGFADDVFLRIKIQNWPIQQRLCVLMFDEVALKKHLDYNTKFDIIEGFQDLGELGRKNAYASEALVFMVAGLCSRWKIPVAYFLSASCTKANDLKYIIQNCIAKLKECDLIIKAVICDQGPNNRSAITKLNISEENPVLEVDGENVYFFYDVPHLIKSIRNQFIVNDFIFDDQIVSWKVIQDTYNLDKQSKTAKSLPKLSDIHLYPNNFQKMRCKLAYQIFSNSMAAAIRTAVLLHQLAPSSEATANFIQFINCLCDSLNSSNKCTKNKNRLPLSDKNVHIKDTLENGLKVISTLKTVNGKIPPCFNGLKQSIAACLMLYNDIKKKYNVEYLLKRRLTQDMLENTFTLFRHKGGFNSNPTSKSFRLSFRHIFCANLKKTSIKSNCEEDSHEFSLFKSVNISSEQYTKKLTIANSITINNDSKNIQSKIENKNILNTTLEDCSVRYTAGFILRKVLQKFKCSTCMQLLKSSSDIQESNEELIKQKAYPTIRNKSAFGNLCTPSNLIYNVVRATLNIFSEFYSEYKSDTI